LASDADNRCPLCNDNWAIPAGGWNDPWRTCECVERENKRRRMRFAEVPAELKGHKINDFDLSLYQTPQSRQLATNAKRMAANYVKNYPECAKLGKGLYLYSEMPGSGKTRLAVSIANALWDKYSISVGFMSTIDLLQRIKATFNKNDMNVEKQSQEQLIKTVCAAELFIFDDIGTEKPTDWVEEMMFHIINSRLTQLKPTIFTSNCATEHLTYAEKLKQRIAKMTIPVPFPNESVRMSLMRSENEQLQIKLLGVM